MMNKENLRELLVEKYDYKNNQVESVIEKIGKFSAPVAAAFENWLNTGEIGSLEIEGYTVASIMQKRPMKTVAAFLALDWLAKDPASAKAALNEPRIKNSAAGK